jgi:hypothetical protein
MFRLIAGLILILIGFVTLKWVFGVVLNLLLWGALGVGLLGVGFVVTKALTSKSTDKKIASNSDDS